MLDDQTDDHGDARQARRRRTSPTFGPQFTGGDFGVGVGMGIRKSDADLTAKFNEALKAAFADGSIKKYSMKWFKIDTTP